MPTDATFTCVEQALSGKADRHGNDGFRMKPRPNSNLVGALLIGALALLAYSNSFSVPFQLDDVRCIAERESIHNLGACAEIYFDNPRRFIPNLSLAVNYHFHGTDVPGYHIFNLLVHICSGLAVWRIALLVFGSRHVWGRKKDFPIKTAALFAGLIFISHPVQTQAVTYIVQRMASLAALFYFLAVLLYAKFRKCHIGGPSLGDFRAGVIGTRKNCPALYALAVVCAVLAVHSKETAFTLPLAIVLFEICFAERESKWELAWCLPFFAVAAVIPLYIMMPHAMNSAKAIKVGDTGHISRWHYLLTQSRVVVVYLRLLLLPIGQNISRFFDLSKSVLDPRVLGSCSVLAAVAGAGLVCFRKHRLVTFVIMWFFITLSVESTVIPIFDVYFEHRLYLPMLGLALMLPYLFLVIPASLKQHIGSASASADAGHAVADSREGEALPDPPADGSVLAVVVNYNGGDHVLECLASLKKQTHKNLTVVVVDNESSDGSLEAVRNEFPDVETIESGWNAGWGIACNIGIRARNSEFVALVNNDAFLEDNCVEEMLSAIRLDDAYGSCASKILLWDAPETIEVAGLVIYRDGSSVGRGRLESAELYSKSEEVFCANDCCCLYRRSMLCQIGLYDPDFFMYCDETDMGWRHQLAGWKCIYAPAAVAYHAHSRAAGDYSDFKAYHVERNRLFLCIKHFPMADLIASFPYAMYRYACQIRLLKRGAGSLARYREESSLAHGAMILARAHLDALRKLPVMLRKRMHCQRIKTLPNTEIRNLFKRFGVSAKEMASYE